MGWGSYDAQYKIMPYWGMFGGELLHKLNDKGYDCYAASVSGTKSAWDRACELYAQLTGTVVDYGEEHSTRCGHERFGTDYTGRALVEKWDNENKINLLGHSFGGATMRVFASLMAKGSDAEMKATDKEEISPLFTGGKEDWIYSLTSLAAPHNGTYSAIKSKMEFIFVDSANEIGSFIGKTRGGFEIDESWQENDGLVNTISAMAPSSAPSKIFDENNIEKGTWQIMPTYQGDHMSLQGGFFKVNTDVEDYYTKHLNMINCL